MSRDGNRAMENKQRAVMKRLQARGNEDGEMRKKGARTKRSSTTKFNSAS